MAKKSKSKKSKTVVNNSEAENSTTLVEQTEKDLNPNMVETISDEDVATGGQELSADENVDLQSDSNEESIEHESERVAARGNTDQPGTLGYSAGHRPASGV